MTGAASGIGRATAAAMAQADVAVAMVDRDTAGMELACGEIRSAGGVCQAFPIDLSDWSGVPALVETVLSALGRIDILVNAAGVSDGQSLLDLDAATWDRVYAINVRSPLALMQEVGRHMIARGGGGKIVNVSSSSAFRSRSTPACYGSSKAALNHLTRVAACEFGPHDINVNAVVPGVTATAMTAGMPPEVTKTGPLANFFDRVSQADDVANVIRFLCLPESRQITGQMVHTSAGAVT